MSRFISAVRRGGESGILEELWARLVKIRVAVVNSKINFTIGQRMEKIDYCVRLHYIAALTS